MSERSKATKIIHSIWAISGVVVGAGAALLWMGEFKSEWVEATGTWFGATATVLALLWAVQTFRADQTHREAERDEREEARREALETSARAARDAELEAEALVLAEASRMVLSLAGGAGQGNGSDMQMTSVHVDLANDSSRSVIIESFELDQPLVAKRYPQFPIRVASSEAQRITVDIQLIDAYSNELSGAPLPRFTAKMTYRLDGRTWVRSSADASIPKLAE